MKMKDLLPIIDGASFILRLNDDEFRYIWDGVEDTWFNKFSEKLPSSIGDYEILKISVTGLYNIYDTDFGLKIYLK